MCSVREVYLTMFAVKCPNIALYHVDVWTIFFYEFYSVSGQRDVGPNGKVNNMVSGYEAAKYDLIIISDTGIKSESNLAIYI